MQSALHAMSKPTTQASLPPLQNLPSWSRSGLQRKKEQRSINRDCLDTVSTQAQASDGMKHFHTTESNQKSLNISVSGRIVSAPSVGHEVDSRERVVHLEKSLVFLQEQHSETLGNLHREIEKLKWENKELNFKLVMAKSGINIAKAESPGEYGHTGSLVKEEIDQGVTIDKTTSKEKQNVGVTKERQSLTKSASKPQQRALDEKKSFHRQFSGKKIAKPTPPSSAKNNSAKSRNSAKVKLTSKAPQQAECRMDNTVLHAVPLSKQNVKSQMPPRRDGLTTPVVFMVTLSGDSKVKVHIPSETEPRSPTLSECNAIIKQQQETNYKQAQELSKLKMNLKDIRYTHSNVTDPQLMSKAYVSEGSRPVRENVRTEYRSLPKLNTHQVPRLTNRVRVNQESISLPALRPNLNPTVAERRKRQQAVLRGRGTTAKRDY